MADKIPDVEVERLIQLAEGGKKESKRHWGLRGRQSAETPGPV